MPTALLSLILGMATTPEPQPQPVDPNVIREAIREEASQANCLEACIEKGSCHRPDLYCQPTSDSDCAQSNACSTLGRCAQVGAMCVVDDPRPVARPVHKTTLPTPKPAVVSPPKYMPPAAQRYISPPSSTVQCTKGCRCGKSCISCSKRCRH
jgi:hypothetical protein